MSQLSISEKHQKLISYALTNNSVISSMVSQELLEEASIFAKESLKLFEFEDQSFQQYSLIYLLPLLTDDDMLKLLDLLSKPRAGVAYGCSSRSDALQFLEYLAFQIRNQLGENKHALTEADYFINVKILSSALTRLSLYAKRNERLGLAQVLSHSNDDVVSLFKELTQTVKVDTRKMLAVD